MNEIIDEIRQKTHEFSLMIKESNQKASDFKILIHPEIMRQIFIDDDFYYLNNEVGVCETISKHITGIKCDVSPNVKRFGILYEKTEFMV